MPNFRGGFLNQGQALGAISQTVLLTADNTVVNPAALACQMINLESDNTTAANRTFTLTAGSGAGLLDGQLLYLVFTSGSSTAAQLADSGNVILSAAWEPTLGDTLTLIYNARVAVWVELCRADN